jgi:hypothetical protein
VVAVGSSGLSLSAVLVDRAVSCSWSCCSDRAPLLGGAESDSEPFEVLVDEEEEEDDEVPEEDDDEDPEDDDVDDDEETPC